MSTPALASLRAGFPDAHIAFSCTAPISGLFRPGDLIDELRPVNRRSWKGISGWFRRRTDLRALARSGWDICLICGGGSDGKRFAALRPAPLCLDVFNDPRTDPIRHQSRKCLTGAQLVGGSDVALHYRIADRQPDQQVWPPGEGPRMVVNPGAGGLQKRWPPSRFRRVAEHCIAAHGARIVVVWGPGEKELAEAVLCNGACLAPQSDIAQLADILAGADLVLTGDSGPMHMAAGLNRPVVALFSVADPEAYGPVGPVTIIRHPGRIDDGGMPVEDVIGAVDQVLRSRQGAVR